MYRISAVSYLNTVPFVFGIKQSGYIDNYQLLLDVPSVCADKIINSEADIGLIPVSGIPYIKNCEIISDYCIGSQGKVKTVVLASKIPLNNISEVYLDLDSRTSAKLIKILAEKFWKKSIIWKDLTSLTILDNCDSVLLIGDKVFKYAENYEYIYDLSEEWFKFTSLPFTFACWVANKKINENFKKNFNLAIKYGVENKVVAVKNSNFNTDQAIDYIENYISYDFDKLKRQALDKFFKLG